MCNEGKKQGGRWWIL